MLNANAKMLTEQINCSDTNVIRNKTIVCNKDWGMVMIGKYLNIIYLQWNDKGATSACDTNEWCLLQGNYNDLH